MKKIEVQASYFSKASPADIYPLVKNSATYPFWSVIEQYEMVSAGRGEPHGVGTERLFKTGRNVMHEQVVELVPDRRVVYLLLSGFPMRDYRAETLLEPGERGGTKITWRTSFYPEYWGTGFFWRTVMKFVFRRFVRDLARAAEDPPLRAAILSASQGSVTSKPPRGTLLEKQSHA